MFRTKESFQQKNVNQDIIQLRYKHYLNRLVDTITRVLDERNEVKRELARAELRNQHTQRRMNMTTGSSIDVTLNASISPGRAASPIKQIERCESPDRKNGKNGSIPPTSERKRGP